MSPLEIIRDAQRRTLVDEDGEPVELQPYPGLSDEQLTTLESRIPCHLPDHIRELLRYCRGFDGSAAEWVDFTGADPGIAIPDVFPHGLTLAGDGYGNFWVADLTRDSKDFAPIYFTCHDAPVVLYQSPTLPHFLTELFKIWTPPHESIVDDVHEDRLFKVWRKNPFALSQACCLESGDSVLEEFARQLDESYHFFDLRRPQLGAGFPWGRYRLPVIRFGELPVFACKRRWSWVRRLLGR